MWSSSYRKGQSEETYQHSDLGIWRLIYKKKYSCNQCDHQATGNKYCNKRERERGTGVLTLYYFYSSPDTIQCSLSLSLCETTALSQWERTHHLKSDPEGIRYPCSSCKYKSRDKGKLNSHMQVKHKEGSQKFPISQCEYKASIIWKIFSSIIKTFSRKIKYTTRLASIGPSSF